MYTRIKELLEQALLEFDPRQEKRNFDSALTKFAKTRKKGGEKATSKLFKKEKARGISHITSPQDSAAAEASNSASRRDKRGIFSTEKNRSVKKSRNRQLSRGGDQGARAGPKGKLPK